MTIAGFQKRMKNIDKGACRKLIDVHPRNDAHILEFCVPEFYFTLSITTDLSHSLCLNYEPMSKSKVKQSNDILLMLFPAKVEYRYEAKLREDAVAFAPKEDRNEDNKKGNENICNSGTVLECRALQF